jgi:hypothetical protein
MLHELCLDILMSVIEVHALYAPGYAIPCVGNLTEDFPGVKCV